MEGCAIGIGGAGFPAMRAQAWLGLLVVAAAVAARGEAPGCRVVPRPDQRTALVAGGPADPVTWHFGAGYPRPFFYPFPDRDGESLTRMGHPGAPNHDHHRSIWFGHADVQGSDFWSDRTGARIRQKQWLAYRDDPGEAVMAVLLGWFAADGRELMEQELVAALIPDDHGCRLELQSTFRPAEAGLELGRTNFGFLGVRMARHLSVHFGSGEITDSEGRRGEKEIFGQRARWVDYSGRSLDGSRRVGITFIDHPANPRYPTHWHVREDGWMGASFAMKEACRIRRSQPLQLRYLLFAHDHPAAGAASFNRVAEAFAGRPPLVVRKSDQPHLQFEVRRSRP
jgi:hypothetical protein